MPIKRIKCLGFTIIEILVVIGIILILAAILYPVLSRAKKASKFTVCESNLHQIGIALGIYESDNNDQYPWASDPASRNGKCPNTPHLKRPLLAIVLQPYLKSKDIWHCPLDDGVSKSDKGEPIGCFLPGIPSLFGRFGMSYLYQDMLATDHISASSSLSNPNGGQIGTSRIPVVFDASGLWHEGKEGDVNPGLEKGYIFTTLFGDGHVNYLDLQKLLQSGEWFPNPS